MLYTGVYARYQYQMCLCKLLALFKMQGILLVQLHWIWTDQFMSAQFQTGFHVSVSVLIQFGELPKVI